MSPKLFRFTHFRKNASANPLVSYTFKTKDLKPFRIIHFQKSGGGVPQATVSHRLRLSTVNRLSGQDGRPERAQRAEGSASINLLCLLCLLCHTISRTTLAQSKGASPMKLEGRVALITGAGSGIGRAIAL